MIEKHLKFTLKYISILFFLSYPLHCMSAGDQKIILQAGAVRAACVASEKFSSAIKSQSKYGQLGRFLSDIDNYSISIEKYNYGYLVTFTPLPYDGEQVSGGQAVYRVDSKDYKIISENHYK